MDTALAPLSEAEAVKALEHAKRNSPELDIGTDAQWVAAYIVLRQTKKRVRPEQIVAAHKSRKTETSHAGFQEVTFYGAPKANFPNKVVPVDLQAFLADEVALSEMEARENCKLDRGAYFIFDSMARDVIGRLGKNVSTFGFRLQQDTKYKADVPSAAPLTGGEAAGTEDSTASTSAADAAGSATSAAAGSLPGAAASTNAAPPAEDPQRALRRIYSNATAGELEKPVQRKLQAQLDAMKSLKASILENAAAARFQGSPTDLNKESVFHYASETIEAIRETSPQRKIPDMPEGVVGMGQDGAKPPKDYMAQKFTAFLMDLLYKSPCYTQLHSFEKMPEQLYKMGGADESGADEDVLRLVERLACTSVTSDEVLDTSSVSVFARTPFFESALYGSYVAARSVYLLNAAKEERDGAKRCAVLRRCEALGSALPPSTKDAASKALALFDEAAEPSLAGRGKALVADARASKLAVEWDGDGPVGALASLQESAPDLTKLNFDTFRSASLAAAALLENTEFQVKNSSAKACVTLIAAVNEKWGTAAWAVEFCRRAVKPRLQLKAGPPIDRPTKKNSAPQGECGHICKLLRPVVEPRTKTETTTLPDWYVELQAEALAEKEAAASADKEAADKRKQQEVEEFVAAEKKSAAEAVAAQAQGLPVPEKSPTGDRSQPGQGSPADAAGSATSAAAGSLPGAASSTNDGAAVGSLPDSSPGVAGGSLPAPRIFQAGDTVKVTSPKKKDMHGFTAKLLRSLTNHWWVLFLEGPLKGKKEEKLTKDQLEFVSTETAATQPAAQPAAEKADEDDLPLVQPSAGDQPSAAAEQPQAEAWKAVADAW